MPRERRLNWRLSDQFKGSRNLYSAPDGPGHRASVCMNGVNALDGLSLSLARLQFVMSVDAADDQHAAFHFNFSGDFRYQPAFACINLARFQRTSKSAGQSAACRSYYIIQRGRPWRKFVWRDLVMRSHFRVHTELHGPRFRGEIRKPHGPDLPLDPHSRSVGNLIIFRHDGSLTK